MGKQIIEDENQDVELSFIGGNSHLTQEERETILIIDDKNKIWSASTSIPSHMRKFESKGWKCLKDRTVYYRDGEICTKFYEAPKASISIGKYERPKRQGRELTEEHKAKMKAARNKALNLSEN
jgi:hypothetical protein